MHLLWTTGAHPGFLSPAVKRRESSAAVLVSCPCVSISLHQHITKCHHYWLWLSGRWELTWFQSGSASWNSEPQYTHVDTNAHTGEFLAGFLYLLLSGSHWEMVLFHTVPYYAPHIDWPSGKVVSWKLEFLLPCFLFAVFTHPCLKSPPSICLLWQTSVWLHHWYPSSCSSALESTV